MVVPRRRARPSARLSFWTAARPLRWLCAAGCTVAARGEAEDVVAPASTSGLPCGDGELVVWRHVRSLLQDQVGRYHARLPFGLIRPDAAVLNQILAELQGVNVDDTSLLAFEMWPSWTECDLGLLAVRLLFTLSRFDPAMGHELLYVIVEVVLAAPWIDVLLQGWPIFSTIALLARWASPYGTAASGSAQYTAAGKQQVVTFISSLRASECDAREVGAFPLARAILGRRWRLYTEDAGAAEAELLESLLADVESHFRAVDFGTTGGCRWSQHPDRFLGGLVQGTAEEHDPLVAMAACSQHTACAGITGSLAGSQGIQLSLRRGEPFLQESPVGEASFVRWCPARLADDDPLPCPGPRMTGLLALARQRLSAGFAAFSPELVAEAQAAATAWAQHVGTPRAQADIWASEWPVWELLGKLQERVDLVRSPGLAAAAGAGEADAAAAPPRWAAALQRAVGFTDSAWRLATEEMLQLDASLLPSMLRERVHCASGKQCIAELYARLHVLLHKSGTLPLRDAIDITMGDTLAPLFLERSRKLGAVDTSLDYDWGRLVRENEEEGIARAEELDRLMPTNHPLQVDRRQLAHFILEVRGIVAARPLRRCLEWDQPHLLVRAFRHVCRWFDIFSYSEPDPASPMMGMPGRHEYPHGTRHYWGDLEYPGGPGIEEETFDLILCPFVFEHVSKPFEAMKNLAVLLRKGGYMIWAVPFIQQYHGSPHDYFRYTPKGARSLAESAGLEVVKLYSPGDLALTSGLLNGMLLPYWDEAWALREEPPRRNEDAPRHPTNVFALFRRPGEVEDRDD